MAGVTISDLDPITGGNLADSDLLVVVDISANETLNIKRSDFMKSGVAGKADEIQVGSSSTNDFGHFILFARNNGSPAQYDSVQADGALSCNPVSNRIKATGGFEGTADRALVADSANFNITSLNDVDDTLTGLVTGQILKWNGSRWSNSNDLSGTAGVGVIAKQINTKSASDANVEFLLPLVRAVGADSVEVDGQMTYNASTNSLTVPNLLGKSTGADSATTAITATESKTVLYDSAAAGTYQLIMKLGALAGYDSSNFDKDVSYNTTSQTLSAPNFSGDGSNISNVAASSATTASAVNVSTVGDDATFYIHFGDQTTGTDALNVNTNLNYNPSSGLMSVTNVSYTPSTDAHWADPNPSTVKSALDRLAAAVYALQSNTEIS